MTIGIINAMQKEHAQIAALLSDTKTIEQGRNHFVCGHLGENTLILAMSGIGKVNAAVGALEMIHAFHPDCILNTGVAGGIDTILQVMDVVAGSRVAYHDVDCGPENAAGQVQGLPQYFEACETLYQHAVSIQCDTRIHGGLICSGDQFITDRSQLNKIKNHYPDALAVDMESGAIAQVCYLYNIPFLSFRIISDTPGGEAHFEQYNNFWETMATKSFEMIKAFLTTLPTKL